MTAVLAGVRILEVAEHTFVPAASALLSDWGAEVIKIEHVERGDAMRGLASTGAALIPTDVHVLLEHANRGKKSLGLDLTAPEGREILAKLVATSDVFLTNKMPTVRSKLGIDLDSVRAHNDKIIYVRGTGQGERGPDADKGSYDSLAFWARSGMAVGAMEARSGRVPVPPGPAYGDSIGAMTIAGGIMGALFHRERTGEATTVDVSLLSTGLWAMGAGIALSLVLDIPWNQPPDEHRTNPLTASYQAQDGHWIAFTCLQLGKYWPLLTTRIGRPDLASDARFADPTALMSNHREAGDLLSAVFLERPLAAWREVLADFEGQWTIVQETREAAADPQTVANGYLSSLESAAGVPFHLVTAPIQFNEEPAPARRAPEFNEHGDAILTDLGLDWNTVVDLKARGVVA